MSRDKYEREKSKRRDAEDAADRSSKSSRDWKLNTVDLLSKIDTGVRPEKYSTVRPFFLKEVKEPA